jgi:Flp pilus assembly protein TadG
MRSRFHRRFTHLLSSVAFCSEACGSQIVEFALSAPLLVLFVVGIFDFSGAIALKNKLANAAREGARVAAADPATDMTASMPVAVSDSLQAVDSYLLSNSVSDCGWNTTPTVTNTAGTLTWAASATCPGISTANFQIRVNRGCISSQSVNMGGNTVTVKMVGTCVTINYPYVWKFSGPASLFGFNFIGPTTLSTTAMAFDEN